MRVILLGDARKPGVKDAADELLPWLEGKGKVAGVDLHGGLDLSKVNADAVIVLGGDGSVLHTARRMGNNQMPLVGVNFGRLGFLAVIPPDHVKASLGKILGGEYQISKRLMMACELGKKGGSTKQSLVVNDVVVSRETSSRMSSIRLEIGEERVASYWGDGLIVSTPGGSTAYSLSAGGPIVYPEMEAFLVTPICVHSLGVRPIVTPSSVELCFEVEEGERISVIVDGQTSWPFEIGEKLVVRRAKETLSLLEPKGYNHFHSLYTKLNWGKTSRESD